MEYKGKRKESSVIGTAASKIVCGQLGRAYFDGIYYSRVLLRNGTAAVERGQAIRLIGMQDSVTFLVEPYPLPTTS